MTGNADFAASASGTRRRLLATAALLTSAVAASSVATQFVAWRVQFHPALGVPWFGHVYAPWCWLTWMQAPWAPNARTTFGFVDAGLMGSIGLGTMAGLLATHGRRRRPMKHEGVHGTARFLTEPEIRQSGLLPPSAAKSAGVYVGGWTDAKGTVHYLRHDGPEHCIVIAPTRSGKGVGNILPTLLSWPASCLVYDEKGELWQLTAGWRAQHADSVVIRWEPGAVTGSAGFNFLEEVRLGTPQEVADAQNIAQMICDPNGDGIEGKDHWGKTSFDLLSAVILHVMYRERAKGGTASLADVAYALSDPEEASDALWEAMRSNRHDNGRTHPVVAAAGRDQLDRPEKERGSVLSSAKTYLTLVKDPIIAANTRQSDFRILDLMNHERPVSLYVVTRGGDKERLRPLIRLLLTMAMRQLMGVELKYDRGQPLPPHRHRLLMMLDEFPSLGRLQIIQDALPKCAGYGIKAFLAAQNREQMFGAYGQHQSITANCHVRIVYAPNEWESAEWISRMVGTATIVKEDVTESGTRLGSLKNVSRTYHEVSRPLLTPDEIMGLKKPRRDETGQVVEAGEMVVFIAGERPILGTPILYFRDPVFARRARIAPPPSGATRPRPNAFQVASI
ncbi:MAG: type IV secretory system conjugative DNA transfer family protein [Rhodospirillales bacterium]|nr:type IV secretory system conjugative DNA transfer family protein [Rhodospirillales bacterium]